MTITLIGVKFSITIVQQYEAVQRDDYNHYCDRVTAIVFKGRCDANASLDKLSDILESLPNCKDVTMNQAHLVAIANGVAKMRSVRTAENVRRLEITGKNTRDMFTRYGRNASTYFPYVKVCATDHGVVSLRTGKLERYWSAACGYINPVSTEAVFIAVAALVYKLPLHLAYSICEHVKINTDLYPADSDIEAQGNSPAPQSPAAAAADSSDSDEWAPSESGKSCAASSSSSSSSSEAEDNI
jgi:hypothetical protein